MNPLSGRAADVYHSREERPSGVSEKTQDKGQAMMRKHDLDEHLQQLHRELQQVEFPDATERQLLEQLQTDIQVILAHQDSQGSPSYTQLSERLQEGIGRWETSYPRLTFAMGQISDMLARLGI